MTRITFALIVVPSILVGLVGIACAGVSDKGCDRAIVWSADMETGDLSQWTGASADSGLCTRPPNGVSTEYAHSGKFSMKMTIDTTLGTAGCRQHGNESKPGVPYYYSAWFYIPVYTAASVWWNIFQFKGKDYSTGTNDPFWVINVLPRFRGGPLHLRLTWWNKQFPGPYATSVASQKFFDQGLMDVPTGKWFHVEAYLRQSGAYAGRLMVWQDGVQLWDMVNVMTHFPDTGAPRDWPHQWWSVNNYSNKLTPTVATIYVDDAAVSRNRLGPRAATAMSHIRPCGSM